MAECPSCGRENPGDARFCNACGGALEAVVERGLAQRKVVTILFCDVVGSTALGESTDPEALRARMQRYFADLRRVIERHGGTVEKFVGDAVMAVFGIPTSHEDDALRAVRAAWEMRAAISGHGLEARIGVNTGEVVVGGDGETLVTGDAVNVAARFEQAAPPGEALIGAETLMLVRDAVHTEAVQPLALKGKAEPVAAYRLLDLLPAADGLARRLETPLVGRERERRRLWRDFEDAVEEQACKLFTLLGPAGIGKSRLVADFLDRVGDTADVLRCRCLSYGEGITYWPLVEILRASDVDPDTVIGSAPAETQLAFRRFLEARAAARPQVVVVDDLQWAEPVFVDLVEHVTDLSRGAPIFVLCIARTELLDARPGWGGGRLNATSVLIEPLGSDECAALADSLALDGTLDDELRDRIVAASAGNPLYVEEMLAMVRDRGDGQVVVPPTIQALLQARIDALDGDVRVVMERGAVEGEVFHRGAVAELSPVALREGVETHLATLVRKELIRSTSPTFPDDEGFRFRHLLIRDAAYGALPKRNRADLHERFAGWLERHWAAVNPGELDLIVGYHLEQAYRYRVELGDALGDAQLLAERALLYIAPAGRTALERGDPHAAASLLRRAVRLGPDDRHRIELLLDLRIALRAVGEAEASDRADDEASALLAQHPDEGLEHRRAMTEILFVGGGSIVKIENALRYYERSGDRFGMIRALEAGNYVFTNRGEFDASMEYLVRATGIASELGRPDRAAGFSARAARALPASPMPIPQALDRCPRVLDRAGDNREARATILLTIGELEARGGVREVWRRHFDAAKAIIDDLGLVQPLDAALYPLVLGLTELVAGEPARTVDLLRTSCSRLERLGDVGHLSSLAPLTAQTLLALNLLGDVERYAFWGRDIADSRDLDAHARWRIALSGLRTEQGRHPEAVELAAEAVAILAASGFAGVLEQAHLTLAGALRASGDEPAALTAAQEAWRLAVAKQDQAALRAISAFLRD